MGQAPYAWFATLASLVRDWTLSALSLVRRGGLARNTPAPEYVWGRM